MPVGPRMLEVRSDGASPLTPDEWKALARHCFVNAQTAGDAFKVEFEGMKIHCQDPDDLIRLVEELGRRAGLTMVELAVAASRVFNDSELSRTAGAIARSEEHDGKLSVGPNGPEVASGQAPPH